MFACIHSRSVSNDSAIGSALVELAFTFSPLVEQTGADTVVFDVAGQDLLFGQAPNDAGDLLSRLANAIARRARQAQANVSIAANPDTAIHAARSFAGITIIDGGDELLHLGALSIRKLDCSLAAVAPGKAEEIYETLTLWGVRTFRELAELPLAGVAERLGQEGVRLQRLAQGRTDRRLNLVRPPIGFEQSLELEHAVSELEPLSFILSRLVNQLCANLNEYGLATNEVRLQLVSESRQVGIATGSKRMTPLDPVAIPIHRDSDTVNPTLNASLERTITLPVPMRNPKTLLRLLLFEIEREPPPAPVAAVTITAEPVKPRAAQTGLFVPLAPEPERLEITLARLAKLVGSANVGSPELLDTHRPDAFRLNKFRVGVRSKRNAKNAGVPALPVLAFRIFRPPCRAEIRTLKGQPTHLNARAKSLKLSGRISCAAGPWRASGDWWRSDVWARDEWDVAVVDSTSPDNEILCRIYRDLTNEQWFVAGIYD